MPQTHVAICVVLFALALATTLSLCEHSSKWSCDLLKQEAISSSINYTVLNCTGRVRTDGIIETIFGPLVIHVTETDLTSPKTWIQGASASRSAPYHLQTVEAMTQNASFPSAPILGVNGGYFWRLDSKDFLDDVCFTKSRKEAMLPADPAHPNQGVGDNLLIVNGEVLSCNCEKYGNHYPAAFIMNGTASYIVIQKEGGIIEGHPNVISAGPNLLSMNEKGETLIDIAGDNLNIWEHSADTAIGLKNGQPGNFGQLLMVVSDGVDSCKHPKCGLSALAMACFLRDHLDVQVAMEMDQGGSSTLWIRGRGVVNNNRDGPRHVWDGLFVGERSE